MAATRPSSQRYQETVFYCMPLRLGIFAFAAFTCLSSVIYCLDKTGWESAFRFFDGGYALASRVIIGAIQVTGVLAGWVGLMGVWYVKTNYVLAFYYWQIFRIVGTLLVYIVDIPLLMHCEGWINSVDLLVKEYGWNQLMYDIAMAGQCEHERDGFFICTSMAAGCFMYLTSSTGRYLDAMDTMPRHLLRVPKDAPDGCYYAHALGERALVQGGPGKQDHGSMAYGLPFQGAARAGQSPVQV